MDDTDVIIVGAGPCGLLLAYLLASNGIGVRVLEQHTSFDRAFRGDILQQSSASILSQLGLLQPLLHAGAAIPLKALSKGRLRPSQPLVGAGAAISRRRGSYVVAHAGSGPEPRHARCRGGGQPSRPRAPRAAPMGRALAGEHRAERRPEIEAVQARQLADATMMFRTSPAKMRIAFTFASIFTRLGLSRAARRIQHGVTDVRLDPRCSPRSSVEWSPAACW